MGVTPLSRVMRLGLLLALLLGSWSCGETPPPPPPPSPEALALELLELGRGEEAEGADEATIERLFGPPQNDLRRAALYDAISSLRAPSGGRVVSSATLEPIERIVVDLTAELIGGGEADYSVQLEPTGDSWQIRWFQGPGVEWPRYAASRGEGLSNSAPPGTP